MNTNKQYPSDDEKEYRISKPENCIKHLSIVEKLNNFFFIYTSG